MPEGRAADDEHRELADVPEEVMFATKPQLAESPLSRAQSVGIRAAFVAGDEVYGGRQLRHGIRQRGTGYVKWRMLRPAADLIAVCATREVALAPGGAARRLSGTGADCLGTLLVHDMERRSEGGYQVWYQSGPAGAARGIGWQTGLIRPRRWA